MSTVTITDPTQVLKTLHLPVEVTRSLCDDAVVAATEGGTGYWAWVKSWTHDEPANGGSVSGWYNFVAVIHPEEENYEPGDPELDKDFTINAEAIADGIERWLTDPVVVAQGAPQERSPRWYLEKALRDNDAGDIDADVADVIVQYFCFGKVVFG